MSYYYKTPIVMRNASPSLTSSASTKVAQQQPHQPMPPYGTTLNNSTPNTQSMVISQDDSSLNGSINNNNNIMFFIGKAVVWWCDQISGTNKVNGEMVKKFERMLTELLVLKLKNHWFPDNPTKGQAYRSLSIDKKGRTDPVLLKASKAAGIENIYDCFSYVDDIIMWIDPHEVAVKISYSFVKDTRAKEQVIFKPFPSNAVLKSSPSSPFYPATPERTNTPSHPSRLTPVMVRCVTSTPPLPSSSHNSPSFSPLYTSSSTPSSPYHAPTTPRPPSPIQQNFISTDHKNYGSFIHSQNPYSGSYVNRTPGAVGVVSAGWESDQVGFEANWSNNCNIMAGHWSSGEQDQSQQYQHIKLQHAVNTQQQPSQQQQQQGKAYFWNSGMALEAQA